MWKKKSQAKEKNESKIAFSYLNDNSRRQVFVKTTVLCFPYAVLSVQFTPERKSKTRKGEVTRRVKKIFLHEQRKRIFERQLYCLAFVVVASFLAFFLTLSLHFPCKKRGSRQQKRQRNPPTFLVIRARTLFFNRSSLENWNSISKFFYSCIHTKSSDSLFFFESFLLHFSCQLSYL